jgi:hypothetical protein
MQFENTMRKYNKKVSKSNAKIEKGSFVTVKIPIVDRASGDLPCDHMGFFQYKHDIINFS